MGPKVAAPRRIRRTGPEARAAILDAAERQLVAVGPAAIRLQQVAAEVGVSHPTVLHHFGSREQLVQAVVLRALDALESDVLTAIQSAPDGEEQLAAVLDRVFAAFDARGHGRALAWLALAGMTPDTVDPRLRDVIAATHSRRMARGARTPARSKSMQLALFEDSLFSVILAISALFSQSVIGPSLWRAVGLGDDAGVVLRYRRWLAKLLLERLAT